LLTWCVVRWLPRRCWRTQRLILSLRLAIPACHLLYICLYRAGAGLWDYLWTRLSKKKPARTARRRMPTQRVVGTVAFYATDAFLTPDADAASTMPAALLSISFHVSVVSNCLTRRSCIRQARRPCCARVCLSCVLTITFRMRQPAFSWQRFAGDSPGWALPIPAFQGGWT